jgi:hypothetical protein
MSLVVPYRNPHHLDPAFVAARSKCYLCLSDCRPGSVEKPVCLKIRINSIAPSQELTAASQLLRGYSSPLSRLFPEESDNINSVYHLAYD